MPSEAGRRSGGLQTAEAGERTHTSMSTFPTAALVLEKLTRLPVCSINHVFPPGNHGAAWREEHAPGAEAEDPVPHCFVSPKAGPGPLPEASLAGIWPLVQDCRSEKTVWPERGLRRRDGPVRRSWRPISPGRAASPVGKRHAYSRTRFPVRAEPETSLYHCSFFCLQDLGLFRVTFVKQVLSRCASLSRHWHICLTCAYSTFQTFICLDTVTCWLSLGQMASCKPMLLKDGQR